MLDGEGDLGVDPSIGLTRTSERVTPGSETADLGAPAPARGAAAQGAGALPRYEVLGRLGEGAVGTVYLAREANLRRRVALKQFKQGARDPAALARFVAEAQVTAQLDHPGVVPVYALEQGPDGATAYTMKPIEGRSLRELIEAARARWAGGRLSAREAEALRAELLQPFLRVCDAVHFAHSRGVVHRDLKPENVMVGRFGEVYVVDWGLARLRGVAGPSERAAPDATVAPEVEEGLEDELRDDPADDAPAGGDPDAIDTAADPAGRTTVGHIKGTPLYMSPEQARGEAGAIGPAADVYALGLVLYELAYLERARGGRDVREVVRRARDNQLEPPPRAHDTSPELRAIVARATATDPPARYPSAEELGQDVWRLLRGEETRAAPDGPARRVRRAVARHPVVALTLAFAALATTLGASALGVYRERLAVAQREQAAARLASAVGERAQAIGGELIHYEGLTAGLAAALGYAIERGRPDASPRHMGEAFADPATAPPDVVRSTHYGKPVSPRWPVFAVPPATPAELAGADLALLAGLRGSMRALFRDASGAAAVRDPASLDRAIVEHATPVEWIYVALERSGAIVLFPGAQPVWDASYDPRRRPWYLEAKAAFELERRSSNWSSPYLDLMGSGLVVTCTEVVVAPGGALAGVAGLDLSVSSLAAGPMRLPQLPGWRRSVLLDAQRRVLLDTDEERRQAGPDGALALAGYPLASVVDARPAGIASASDAAGQAITLAWARLQRIGWTLVVEVEPDAASR